MSNTRVWLFRVLILAVLALMIVSWFMPWWAADVVEIKWPAEVQIHPWGLESAPLSSFAFAIAGSDMPVWFAPAMWAYFGLFIGLLLFSLFAKEKEVRLAKLKSTLPKVLIGGVGLSFILIVVTAAIVIAIRTGDFYGVKLIGTVDIVFSEFEVSDVVTGLNLGYWLACSVGPLLIVLALFRNKIIGQRLMK